MVAKVEGDRAAAVPLHGRSSILALIAGALDAAERGEGRVILITGPPGIGKTAVLDAAVHRAQGRGFRVASARAIPRDTPVPFDLLRNLLPTPESAPPASTGKDGRSALPAWLTNSDQSSGVTGFPTVAILPPGDAPVEKRILELFDFERSLIGVGRRLLYAEILNVLLGESTSLPLLLATDDLELADRDSLDFLHTVAGLVASRRFILIATVDTSVAAAGHRGAILDAIAKGPSVDSVALSPLSLDETAEAIRDIRPGPTPSPEYIRAIHQRSKGVPGAIEQWKRRYKDAIPPPEKGGEGDGSADATPFSPGRVPEETLRILTYGAVIGRQFDLTVLARTLHRRSADVLEPLLAPLVENGTLRARGNHRYEFSSPAVRQEIYSKLAESRRRLMHRNVARALEIGARSAGPELFEISYHYHLSGETVPSVDYNRRAAEVSVRQYAYEEARIYLERALDSLWQLPSSRPEMERVIRLSLGHVLARLGKIADAIQVLEPLRDPTQVGPGGLSPLELLSSSETRPDLWAHAQSARTVAERSLRAYQSKGELRWLAVAHRALGVAAWSVADPSTAEEHHRAASELARSVGDPRLEGQSLLDRAHLVRLLDPNGLALSRQLLTEAVERFTASGDAEWLAKAYLDRSAVLRTMGRLADALSDLTAAADQASKSGSETLEIWVDLRTVRVLIEEGRTGRARKTLERIQQLAGESPRREVQQQLAFINGMLHEREGRYDKALPLYEQSLALATESGSREEASVTHRHLAGVKTKLGRVDEARQHLEEAERLAVPANMPGSAANSG